VTVTSNTRDPFQLQKSLKSSKKSLSTGMVNSSKKLRDGRLEMVKHSIKMVIGSIKMAIRSMLMVIASEDLTQPVKMMTPARPILAVSNLRSETILHSKSPKTRLQCT